MIFLSRGGLPACAASAGRGKMRYFAPGSRQLYRAHGGEPGRDSVSVVSDGVDGYPSVLFVVVVVVVAVGFFVSPG